MRADEITRLPGVSFNGSVTFQGPMFDIHDNHHVTIMNNKKDGFQTDDDGSEYVDLRFFDEKYFGSIASQSRLRRILRGVLPRIDKDNGRDWVVVYIAYHYYIGREFIMKGYADFFSDIEQLLPDVLSKVNKEETSGDKRYKAYTELFRRECQNWFIEDECLPPMNEWCSQRFAYPVDNERRSRTQRLVKDIYQRLKNNSL